MGVLYTWGFVHGSLSCEGLVHWGFRPLGVLPNGFFVHGVFFTGGFFH